MGVKRSPDFDLAPTQPVFNPFIPFMVLLGIVELVKFHLERSQWITLS